MTWISTGQLKTAKRRLTRTLAVLSEHVRSGGFVVGLEPSCLSVFRADGPELLSDDVDAERLRKQSVTLAELLGQHTPGWRPPRLDGLQGVAQVHCHQHAVLGWDADRNLLEQTGARIERLESGCCGLAGNFGFEPGHLEISKACAEDVLLPAIGALADDEWVLADGFSCQTQIHELHDGGHEAVHLAQLLEHGRIAEQTARHSGTASAPSSNGRRPRSIARAKGGGR